MRFSEFYGKGQGPIISFEVFPPKDEAGMQRLDAVLPELLELQPDFMTCTYGAMGSTREKTIEIATRIQERHGLPAACHLTCVGSSREQLGEIVDAIHAAGIRNIVALRGDPPKGERAFTPPPDGLAHGNEMVAFIRAHEQARGYRPFGIAVAGYPEKHHEATSFERDLDFLKQKVDAGADAVITQLFFDSADFRRFADKARAAGIKVPLVAGLLPILSVKQIRRIAKLCAARIPNELQEQLDRAEDDDVQAEQVGVEWCTQQVKDLVAGGVEGFHFYVLNKVSHVQKILKATLR